MNAKEFKEYIKEDIERVEKVLESAGCHKIWRSRDEIRSAPPDGENHTSISVNIDTLYCQHYKEGSPFRGDIISLVQTLRNESFSSAFRFLKSVFGISSKFDKSSVKADPLSLFKGIRRGKKDNTDIKDIDVDMFGREALADFVMLPHINLFYEGITTQTQEVFNVSYDPLTDRIVFPHFHYSSKDIVVGMTGRTLRSDEEMKQFKIPKYWNFIKGYKKMYNLYGFSHNIEFIVRDGLIIIYEAEKSVMKESSMTRNEGHGVAVGGHELSPQQVQIILQNTPADVEVVIAFDKDVMTMKDDDGEDIGEQYLIDTCKRFSKYRKASYIFDTYNILGEKDSPVDKGVKIWNHLLKYRKAV